MTVEEVNNFFKSNIEQVNEIIKLNKLKSYTINKIDITSDLYLIAIENREKFETQQQLHRFLCVTCSNLYRWKNSSYNKENIVISNDYDIPITHDSTNNDSEIKHQNRIFALKKYLKNALPSQKIFYDLYVNQNVRSIRKVRNRLNISFGMANFMIKEFKSKIQEYEREIEIESEQQERN